MIFKKKWAIICKWIHSLDNRIFWIYHSIRPKVTVPYIFKSIQKIALITYVVYIHSPVKICHVSQKYESTLLHTYILNEFLYNKIFLKKLLYKFVVHIFTLLLATFMSKLVNYSRHSESLKYVWKSTNRCDLRKISSISEFFRMHSDV